MVTGFVGSRRCTRRSLVSLKAVSKADKAGLSVGAREKRQERPQSCFCFGQQQNYAIFRKKGQVRNAQLPRKRIAKPRSAVSRHHYSCSRSEVSIEAEFNFYFIFYFYQSSTDQTIMISLNEECEGESCYTCKKKLILKILNFARRPKETKQKQIDS